MRRDRTLGLRPSSCSTSIYLLSFVQRRWRVGPSAQLLPNYYFQPNFDKSFALRRDRTLGLRPSVHLYSIVVFAREETERWAFGPAPAQHLFIFYLLFREDGELGLRPNFSPTIISNRTP